MVRALQSRIAVSRAQVAGLADRLRALSPDATLSRGYCRVRRVVDGRLVRSINDVSPELDVAVDVSDGTFRATVRELESRRRGESSSAQAAEGA